MRVRATPKEWQQLLTLVHATPGWSVAPARNGHVGVRGPDGQAKQFGRTLSDWRGVLNNRADLRRMGWPDPERQCKIALELPTPPTKEATMAEEEEDTTPSTGWPTWLDETVSAVVRAERFLFHHPERWWSMAEIAEHTGVRASMATRVREVYDHALIGVHQRWDPDRTSKGLAAQFRWMEAATEECVRPRVFNRTGEEADVSATVPAATINGTHDLVLDRLEVVDDEQVWITPDGETFTIMLVPVEVVRRLKYKDEVT